MKTINSFRSKLLALTLALMASVSSFAKDGYPDFQVDELYYNFLEGDSVQVTFLMPPTIPTEVAADASNKKNVSGAGYVHLTEIVIPSTVIYEDKTYHVTRIGHGAFMYCPNLMHIDLPTSIKSIGKGAFHNCRYLSSITLNEGLESIEQQAFYDCVRLKEMTLPSTLKTMGQGIFYFSTDLEKVTCKAIVPPTVEKDVLTATDNYNAAIIANATLYVPAQSLITYQNTYPWNTFGQILPIETTLKEQFPFLAGLQRTEVELSTIEGDVDPYHLSFKEYTPTLVNGKLYLCDGRNYFREENNQVLLYAPYLGMEEDLVLYDWTLEVGDTLPFKLKRYTDEELGMLFRVTDVSTIQLLDGKEYKKWTFSGGYEFVEGIGAINKGFGHFYCLRHTTHTGMSAGRRLVCASRNGQLLYQMDDAEMERLGAECLCDYDRGPRKDNAKDGQIGGRPTPTQWNQLEVEFREMENGNTILQAETFSYTLEDISQQVNSKTYFQLARQSTKDTATTKSIVGALHFGKEEDNRVYFLRDGVEYVLYDFTAEPGDTIEIFAGINNYPQETTYTHVVVDKDTTEDGACRMFLEVVFPEETTTATNAEKVWLAGLGSVDGIVHNAAKRTSNAHATPSRTAHSSNTQTSVMLCAWRDDDCLYTTNHPDYNSYGCVYNQDPTAVEDVETLGTQYQKILRTGHLYILRDNKLYDVLGTPMN